MEPYTRREHAGVIVEVVQDDEQWGVNPLTQQDNAGTIYSWTRDFTGDELIDEPELLIDESTDWNENPRYRAVDLPEYMALTYNAVLTLPLHYADYGSSGARIYMSNRDPNCAICFTQEDLDKEWHGSVDDATKYAEARIDELDQWMQGYVWGIVIREDTRLEPTEDIENSAGEVLESVWGFIGEPDAEYIVSEANSMAESCAEQVQAEKRERFEWACRDVVTV